MLCILILYLYINIVSCFYINSYNSYNSYNRLYSTTTNNNIQYRINSIVDPKTIISLRLRHIAVLNEELVLLL